MMANFGMAFVSADADVHKMVMESYDAERSVHLTILS